MTQLHSLAELRMSQQKGMLYFELWNIEIIFTNNNNFSHPVSALIHATFVFIFNVEPDILIQNGC